MWIILHHIHKEWQLLNIVQTVIGRQSVGFFVIIEFVFIQRYLSLKYRLFLVAYCISSSIRYRIPQWRSELGDVFIGLVWLRIIYMYRGWCLGNSPINEYMYSTVGLWTNEHLEAKCWIENWTYLFLRIFPWKAMVLSNDLLNRKMVTKILWGILTNFLRGTVILSWRIKIILK